MTLLLMVVAGGAGAVLLRLIRFPLWAFTGGLLGASVFHLWTGTPETIPTFLVVAAQLVVGCAIGAQFGRGILRDFGRVLTAGALAVAGIVLAGLGLGLLLGAVGLFDPTVAVFGFAPGGVAEMVTGAAAVGADGSAVAAVHLLRLLIVIGTLPLLTWLVRSRPDS